MKKTPLADAIKKIKVVLLTKTGQKVKWARGNTFSARFRKVARGVRARDPPKLDRTTGLAYIAPSERE
jgi:hypothetical protein